MDQNTQDTHMAAHPRCPPHPDCCLTSQLGCHGPPHAQSQTWGPAPPQQYTCDVRAAVHILRQTYACVQLQARSTSRHSSPPGAWLYPLRMHTKYWTGHVHKISHARQVFVRAGQPALLAHAIQPLARATQLT